MSTLSERLAALATEISDLEMNRDDLRTEVLLHQMKVRELEEELRKLKEPPLPPVDRPVEDPNVLIILDGKEYRPTGPGELWPLSGERRWKWQPYPDMAVVLDAKGKQRRVFAERCYDGKLPAQVPVRDTHIKVALDGETFYDGPVRVHQGTRPCMTFRREPLDMSRVAALAKAGLLPRYDPAAKPSPEFLDKAAYGTSWDWKLWGENNKAGTYDYWSENFGIVTRSWVGGIPAANEASMLPPWDVMLLMSGHQTLHQNVCGPTWDSSGNYGIHFWNRETGMPYRPEELPASIPMLNADNLPALTSASGLKLPVGDIAHDFGLANFAALATGERYHMEELEAWTLLGSVARKGEERASGIYFSGQVRSSAWWLRNLYHLRLCYAEVDFPIGRKIERQLRSVLRDWRERFVNPASPSHLKSGLTDLSPYREVPWTKNAKTKNFLILSGNHYFLAHVLAEVGRNPFFTAEVEPLLRHVLKVAEGVWKHSPAKHAAAWLQHAAAARTDDWPTIMANTFANGAPPDGKFSEPLTTDIVAWWRSAVVAGVDLGLPWSSEALAWVDAAIKASGRKPSVAWAILPNKEKP